MTEADNAYVAKLEREVVQLRSRLASEQAVLAAAREYARAWASFRTQRGPETAEATYAATNRLLHAAEALPFEAAS